MEGYTLKFIYLGSILMMFGGLLYTLERINAYLSTYVMWIGSASGADLTVFYPKFLDNFFVPFFLFLGIFVCSIGFYQLKIIKQSE